MILGVLLTYYSYTDIGKVVFLIFIIIFLLTFWLKDQKYVNDNIDIKGFNKIIKKNKNIKKILVIPALSGLTYSSGILGLIITLEKINNFKTNLYLGYVDSICAVLSLITAFVFAWKLKKKLFKNVSLISGILSFIVLILFVFFKNEWLLYLYLVVRFSFILIINLISDVVTTNVSNSDELKNEYKTELYLYRDVIFSVSRCFGYVLLLVISLLFGMEYINYLLILCACSLLFESILISKLCEKI